ncbi:hypothetical protein NSND_60661 [Nitrospira sp. ND1]|nr:hypothetical protein NSND_60661 [Nitrospira sp. ND1]
MKTGVFDFVRSCCQWEIELSGWPDFIRLIREPDNLGLCSLWNYQQFQALRHPAYQ